MQSVSEADSRFFSGQQNEQVSAVLAVSPSLSTHIQRATVGQSPGRCLQSCEGWHRRLLEWVTSCPEKVFGSPWSAAFLHGVGSKDTSQKEVWKGSHGRNSSALFHLRSLDHHGMDWGPTGKNVLPVSEERTRDSQVCSSPEATSAHPFPWWPSPGENPAAQC